MGPAPDAVSRYWPLRRIIAVYARLLLALLETAVRLSAYRLLGDSIYYNK